MKLSDYPYIDPTKGTFAGFTLETRFPKILKDVLDTPELNPASKTQLTSLLNNLDNQRIEPIELTSEESVFWQPFFEEYSGKRFEEVPFFFLEIYFYRLINQIIASNQDFIDPFGHIKRQDLKKNTAFFKRLASDRFELSVDQYIHLAVEGNQADLSQLAGSTKGNPLTYLIDDSNQLIHHIPETGIHLIADNSGVELFTDLLLITKLSETCKQVTLHLKHMPLLVSDATPNDLEILLKHLEVIGLLDFVSEIKQLLDSSKLQVTSHPFWNSPTFYNKLPFIEGETNLLLTKGDANYRRFFHDKAFPPHLSFELETIGFDKVFTLRTLKSDIQTGLKKEQVVDLHKHDPEWMHNGKYAVIQQLK
ncbi:damage-control phosphatase ARMT1 family protein [Marinoscillum pacificum]|uniref:damage-control phosphatase ARMT1 family protein n=1 Tax=Marinoscillum pacificum TaxID=392723 RepID=UPI0021589152|nr:damage-control phosphatase ARMT1 family protein [Marinoscillum pacificum]